MEKKEAAWHLYKEGVLQKDIARILNVTEQTVVSWKQKDKWAEKMHRHQELFESNAQRVQELIAYQLRALKRKVEGYEKEGCNTLIEKGEIDALSKLYATIKTRETSWSNYIAVCKKLLEFISNQDIELAKALTDRVDDFLRETRENING